MPPTPRVKNISLKKLQRIERVLRSDIRWLVNKGPGWDPTSGLEIVNDKWSPVGGVCGTCALGAHVLRHCTLKTSEAGEVPTVVARALRVDPMWAETVFQAVTLVGLQQNSEDLAARIWCMEDHINVQAANLGYRLRDYGDAYVAKKAAQ